MSTDIQVGERLDRSSEFLPRPFADMSKEELSQPHILKFTQTHHMPNLRLPALSFHKEKPKQNRKLRNNSLVQI